MPDKYVHQSHDEPGEKDYKISPSAAGELFNKDPKTIHRWATQKQFLCFRRSPGGWMELSETCVNTQLVGLKRVSGDTRAKAS